MRTRFFIIVLLQVLAILSIASVNTITLMTGKMVLLRTAPVDPRSLFQGQYVDLSYDISNLNPHELPDFDRKVLSSNYGKRVYVVLEKQGKYWKPVDVELKRPDVASDQVVIAGTIENNGSSNIHVRYGIETYFVPEDVASKIESSSGRFDVEVSVGRSGRCLIKRVLLNGKPVQLKPEGE